MRQERKESKHRRKEKEPGTFSGPICVSRTCTPRPFPSDLPALAADSSAASFHQARKSYVKPNRESTPIRNSRASYKGRRFGGTLGLPVRVAVTAQVRTALPNESPGAGAVPGASAIVGFALGHGCPRNLAMDGLWPREGCGPPRRGLTQLAPFAVFCTGGGGCPGGEPPGAGRSPLDRYLLRPAPGRCPPRKVRTRQKRHGASWVSPRRGGP